jgi:tetratricopeptide (TPR) repeat protein
LDPLSVNVLNNYASDLFARGRYEESDRVMQRIRAIAPNVYNYARSWQAWQRGMPSEAIFALLDGLEFDPNDRRIPGGLTNMFGLLGFHDESLRHASESLHYLPYQWISDWETLLDIAQENYSANPDNRRAIAALGQAFLASGDLEAATPHLERYVSGFGDGVGPNVLLAGYVALIRQANGDLEGAQEILDSLKVRYERAMVGGLDNNNNRMTDALINLLEGRETDALTALATLGTGVEPQVAASLRLLTSLKDNPRFDEILKKQAAHFAEEREKLLTRICDENGWENWKPLPRTCER